MARKASRKKATKRHSTAIPAAERVLRLLVRRQEVGKYTCGFIKSGLRSAPFRMKVTELTPKVLQLKIRGSRAVQEFKVFTSDIEATKSALSALDS